MIVTTYQLLSAHPFLTGMTDQQLNDLSAWGTRSVFHAGARVFSEGGRATRFWLIRDGHVNLDTQVRDRGTVVVDTLGPGAVLGWSWLFPPYRWHFGAVTLEETLTVEMDAAGIRRLCEQDPALGYELTRRFTEVVVARLQATRVRLLSQDGPQG